MIQKTEESSPIPGEPASRSLRVAILIVGILLPQIYLYGPALFGRQILLPLDLLALPAVYLPENEPRKFSDYIQTDQVFIYEPARRFAAAEIRAGRWPTWCPYQYAGSPAFGMWSCFQWLYVVWPTPRVLPYIQILSALVAGTGAYIFFRRVFGLVFWPSTVAAWCYPLTGFFALWQGHALPHVVALLPWTLWSTDCAVRRPRGLGGICLAIITFFAIGCGAVDIAGQVLLVSGCYSLWKLVEALVQREYLREFLPKLMAPVGGWALGFILSAGLLLPVAEYLPMGVRMRERAKGSEERPPVGISALPLVVLPELQGMSHNGSIFIGKFGNFPESAATAYAGLIAALLLAPLAGSLGTHRREICFWCVLGFLGMAWALNVPGLVELYRIPMLRMFSFNRFAFVTSWAITCLAALGLNSLWRGIPARRWMYLFPIVLILSLGTFCLCRASNLPEPLESEFETTLRSGKILENLNNLEDLEAVRRWFTASNYASAAACFAALIGWACLISGRVSQRLIFVGASCALLCELVRFAGQSVLMCDSDLYYPRIPVLEQLSEASPGRFLGFGCLPPRVAEKYGLKDIRGYDAVDPAGIVDLLELVRDKRFFSSSAVYSRTQWYVPELFFAPDGALRIPGVLNQLNLRYLVFRKVPLANISFRFSGDGYWVWENPYVLPRAFVPRQVTNDLVGKSLLARMAVPSFDAAEHSYADIISNYANCRGEAQIVRENPQEVVLDVSMETRGVVILSDLWNVGWKAELEGRTVPIVHANYSLRGVEVPVGHSKLVMSYQPASLKWGLRLSFAGLISCAVWACAVTWGARYHKRVTTAGNAIR